MVQPSSVPSPLMDDERVLLLLGLLSEQDRHGYEINDFIENNLQNVIKLKKATAYQLLERMEGHGLIVSRVEQHGLRPNRKVYQLTPLGQTSFQAMLATHLASEEPLILVGNVPVMFLQHLTKAQILQALRTRLESVEARLALYDTYKMHCSSGVGLAMDRIDQLTRADRDWLIDTVQRLEEGDLDDEMTR